MNHRRALLHAAPIVLAACAPSPVPRPALPEVLAARPASYSDARWGLELVASQGCVACHGPHLPVVVGPPLDSMTSGTRTFRDGTTLDVTGPEGQRYLAEAITSPNARVLVGFNPMMPSYAHLNEAQVTALIAYLRCLSEGACDQSVDCADLNPCLPPR